MENVHFFYLDFLLISTTKLKFKGIKKAEEFNIIENKAKTQGKVGMPLSCSSLDLVEGNEDIHTKNLLLKIDLTNVKPLSRAVFSNLTLFTPLYVATHVKRFSDFTKVISLNELSCMAELRPAKPIDLPFQLGNTQTRFGYKGGINLYWKTRSTKR